MNKIILFFLLIFAVIFSFGQSKSDLAGIWRIQTDVGMKKTTPSYLALNADGTYLWGIDSTQSNPDQNVSKGTWDLTTDNDIKIIPQNSVNRITYWKKAGERYEYAGYDKDGKKTPEITLEMTMSIQKIDDTYQVR